MISYEIYKIFHITGIIMIFISLGGVLLHTMSGGDKSNFKAKKVFSITHGLGLLLALVAGFGLLARLGLSFSEGWIQIKTLFWLLLGAYPAFAYKVKRSSLLLWFLLVAIGVISVALVQFKPF